MSPSSIEQDDDPASRPRAARLPRPRRHDPDRRDRIIDACLDVIAEHGLAGTSHRRVAAAADVPLGSMTYHFNGMDDLLREAFTRFADSVAQQAERRMAAAEDLDDALAEFSRNIDEDVLATQRDLVLTLELYTLAARRPEFRDITTTWMTRTRATLDPFVDPRTGQILDAMNEGLTIHRALHADPASEGLAADALARIARGADEG
ncbi:TetR/AcrR family transcriptional regulator [Brachybacterium kimchii]|uniref:TetR family transcriptional regulator n=1 Tax=Brachybacterium kimchii TaxID=2942909 RepID=A0ABY4N5L9_9MICO|nr:TetR family transcriptional regulator [Brachybacterium kimchii]UQN28624.1 TetR family transcriptional regulator [Brachybacterium kimchii]